MPMLHRQERERSRRSTVIVVFWRSGAPVSSDVSISATRLVRTTRPAASVSTVVMIDPEIRSAARFFKAASSVSGGLLIICATTTSASARSRRTASGSIFIVATKVAPPELTGSIRRGAGSSAPISRCMAPSRRLSGLRSNGSSISSTDCGSHSILTVVHVKIHRPHSARVSPPLFTRRHCVFRVRRR